LERAKSKTKQDDDAQAAANELGAALDEVLLGCSLEEIQRVMDAIGAIIDIKLAQFAELMAELVDRLTPA